MKKKPVKKRKASKMNRKKLVLPRRSRSPYADRRFRKSEDLTLINFRVTPAERRFFIDKALKTTNGNVSKMIINSVRLASIQKLRGIY